MLKFYQQRSFRRFLYSKTAFVVLVLILLLLAEAVWNFYGTFRSARTRYASALAELDNLKEQEEFLRSETGRLTSERGVEEEVRKKFNVVKDGEKMVVITEPSEESENAPSGQESSIWSLILKIFR